MALFLGVLGLEELAESLVDRCDHVASRHRSPVFLIALNSEASLINGCIRFDKMNKHTTYGIDYRVRTKSSSKILISSIIAVNSAFLSLVTILNFSTGSSAS